MAYFFTQWFSIFARVGRRVGMVHVQKKIAQHLLLVQYLLR